MHTDPELLSLFALGEDAGTENDRVHARTCPECAADLSELHRVVARGRRVSTETRLVTPSPDVWTRIRDELALDLALEPLRQRSIFLRSDAPEPLAVPRPLHAPGTESAAAHAWRSLLATVKAAVARSGDEIENELLAHAQLAPVETFWSDASGRAELGTDEHGRRLLQVALQAELPTSGLRQAWLIHRDNPNLRQSLGILDGPFGLWTVEHSIDLEEYAILDISQQGIGETGHSGQTIVRGELSLIG